MLAAGALEEARALMARTDLDEGLPALKALGLRELMAYLAGTLDREAAVAAAQMATRHYAKRQMTWFRGQFLAEYKVDKKLTERYLTDSAKKIIDWVLTP